MKRPLRSLAIALFGLALAGLPVFAQSGPALQFRWTKGQTLTYRVKHDTNVIDVANGTRGEAISKLNVVKRWQVLDVDARNVATLQLTLIALRHEQKRANGETLLFDSSDLKASTPELREQMAQHLGKTVASLRIDSMGRVVEVLQGVASRYESELPFVIVLPAAAPKEQLAWQRSFNVSLDPPFGAGEKYPATQTCQIKSIADGKAVIGLTTQFAKLPPSVADQIPLVPKQLDGQVVFDLQTGRLLRASLVVDKTLENHQGEGSNYRFQSQYSEELEQ